MGAICSEERQNLKNNDINKQKNRLLNTSNSIINGSNFNSITTDPCNSGCKNNGNSSNDSGKAKNIFSKKDISTNLKIFNSKNINNNSSIINLDLSFNVEKNDNSVILNQLKGEIETKHLSESINEINQNDIRLNFKEKNIPISDGEKVGCGQNTINTFCIFKSNNMMTFLIYSVKNSMSRYMRIYALNLDNDEKQIIDEYFDDNKNAASTIKKNRHIPTQCKYFKIEQEEYIVAGYRDSNIFIWEINNKEFIKIKMITICGDQINNICLFKDKKRNEMNIFYSEFESSTINVMDFNDDKSIKKININNNIYFLDVLEKDNQLYIISGLLNEVLVIANNENQKYYKNKIKEHNNRERGHECVIIYESTNVENNKKLIDSDCEGKCINIFDFDTRDLLFILDFKNSKPLGIEVWNENHIVVSCLEDVENKFIKIIKVNLTKKLYNQKISDLEKNEDGGEGKIIYSLKGHEEGVLSTKKMINRKYGEFFVSIGMDRRIKLWINDIAQSMEINIR